MPLVILDPSEDRTFVDGETIYDIVDGNAYTVRNGYAMLASPGSKVSYYLGRVVRLCFSRINPRSTV